MDATPDHDDAVVPLSVASKFKEEMKDRELDTIQAAKDSINKQIIDLSQQKLTLVSAINDLKTWLSNMERQAAVK